ncbi:MAG: alpha/beta hydrolase [Candidatus Dormibacteraceae bacterium]
MSHDPQVEAFLVRKAEMGLPANSDLTPEQARAANEEGVAAVAGPPTPVARVTDETIAGVPVRRYDPDPERSLPTLVYLHGGGWVLGSLDTHDSTCRGLAARTPCQVLAVDYRLAPEHPFPAGLEDGWRVLQAVAASGVRPLAVAGDSSGGNLAAVLAVRARDSGLDLAVQILIYPVTDADLTTRSYEAYASGNGMTRQDMEWFWNHYLGDGDRFQPEASPLRQATLAGIAPAHVQLSEYDVLHDEGLAYAERLRAEGVAVEVVEQSGMLHGFIRQAGAFDRTGVAWDQIATALRRAFGGGA